MSESNQDRRTVEESDEGDLLVVDPDDYQKTKKLEAIEDAREWVRDLRQNRMKNKERYEEFTGPWYDSYSFELGQAVAQYGSELLPLIEEGLENGSLSEDDLKIETHKNEINLFEYIRFDGQRIDHETESTEAYHEIQSMAVYRQLNRISRKLGMGLELEEDKGPAQI